MVLASRSRPAWVVVSTLVTATVAPNAEPAAARTAAQIRENFIKPSFPKQPGAAPTRGVSHENHEPAGQLLHGSLDSVFNRYLRCAFPRCAALLADLYQTTPF